MEKDGLSQLITDYIKENMLKKLEPIDKELKRHCSEILSGKATSEIVVTLTNKREEILKKYEVRTWLTDAALRAEKISQATHPVKYFHGDVKGTSINCIGGVSDPRYLTTLSLKSCMIDLVCNSSANLDVAKLLQIEYEGDSLLACLKRGDHRPLESLAENEGQVALWVCGFEQVLSDKTLSSHQLAKQLYFPVFPAGDYHLISPLYSSSLAHALLQRLSYVRYSEDSIAARKAFRERKWHSKCAQYFPDVAVQHIGGTKPQNISYLNSTRGGKNHLLRCAPPQWQQSLTPPESHKTFLTAVSPKVTRIVFDLRRYLHSVYELESTKEIRQQRAEYVDELIGMIFSYAAEIQSLTALQGWSGKEDCELKMEHQLWLDPLRQNTDPEFKRRRERGNWVNEIAEDFAHWLNTRLNQDEKLSLGAVEFREWSVLMRRRLKEFDAAQQENWQ